MKKIIIALFLFLSNSNSQNLDNKIKVTFRAHENVGSLLFVPGQFNGWGPNSNGTIYPGAESQMVYHNNIKAYFKTYEFAIKDPTDTRRNLADSAFQYKFNKGGTDWFGDPLNPETNPDDNSNSVIRLSRLMFFEVYREVINDEIKSICAGVSHALSDTISSIQLSFGTTKNSQLIIIDLLPYFDKNLFLVNYSLPISVPKNNYVKLVAKNNLGKEIIYETGGIVVEQKPLPNYAKHGVTLPSVSSNNKTTFRLRVGGKNHVALKVAPISENVQLANPIIMYKSPGSDDWWSEIILPNGTYEYIYEFENGLTINDPWGRDYGFKGTKFTVGAEGLTADDYVWKNKNFVRPNLNELVLYELSLMEYAGGYFNKPANQINFKDLIKILPHFDSLGVNAIELMPINDWGGVGKSGFSWGYDLNHYFTIEPALGSPRDFKEFVDSSHSHGIAIVLDVVFNHQNDTGPLWKMQQDDIANPYFKSNSDMRPNEDNLNFFKDMDHWTNETQEIVFESLKMWIDDYKIDGFRYDYTQGIGWDISQPTKGILGWSNKIDTLYNGKIYQIAEHLPESPALIYYSGMTSGWHDSFRDKIFDEARFRNVSLNDFENLIIGLGAFGGNDNPSTPSNYSNRKEPINANVTHDEQSLIYEMTQFQGISSSDAILRDKLYATFMFKSLGIPMLWEGMEFGESRGWTSDNQKLSYRPVGWNLNNTQQGKDHFKYYRSLAWQRRKNQALINGDLVKLFRYENEKVLVWGFQDFASNSKIVCVANLSGSNQTINNVTWLNSPVWHDIFNQSVMTVSNGVVGSIEIPRYTAKIFSNKSNTDLGIPTTVKNIKSIPEKFNLLQNYPNPANPTTTINYEIPIETNVKIIISDALGRKVEEYNFGTKEAGNYSFNLDLSKFSTGVYHYTLKTNEFASTRSMIVLK